MVEFKRITVSGEAPYDVVIGRNLLGEVGAFAIQPGFRYALCDHGARDRLLDSRSAV